MQHQSFFDTNPIAAWIVTFSVLLSGLLMFATVRRPLLRWYHSNAWFVQGQNIVDIILKQIGMRLTVEAIAFVVACVVGSLGGNIYTIMRASKMRRPEAVMDE